MINFIKSPKVLEEILAFFLLSDCFWQSIIAKIGFKLRTRNQLATSAIWALWYMYTEQK